MFSGAAAAGSFDIFNFTGALLSFNSVVCSPAAGTSCSASTSAAVSGGGAIAAGGSSSVRLQDGTGEFALAWAMTYDVMSTIATVMFTICKLILNDA